MSLVLTYVERVRDRVVDAVGAGEVESWGQNKERLLDLYTLLALTTGTWTTSEDIHDAWAIATTRTNPTHLALTPFDDLSPEVQASDNRYRDAVRAAAERASAQR